MADGMRLTASRPGRDNDMDKVKPDLTAAHTRYKLADGTVVPGASTVAKVAGAYWSQGTLIKWANREGLAGRDCEKVRDAAANAGTLAHFLIECHVRGQEPDTSDFAPSMVSAAENAYLHWLEWWTAKGFKPVAVEAKFVSEQHAFGGMIDKVAEAPDGRHWLLDYKSGKAIYAEHWCQVAGYWMGWEEQPTTKQPLAGAIICRIGKDDAADDCEFVERTNLDQHKRWFLAGLALYHAQKGCK